MAYDKNELEKKCLELVKQKELIFINELVSYLPCTRGTFYNLELDKLDTLKEALEANRVNKKAQLRAKWFNSDSATLQVALYKLLADKDELNRLVPKGFIAQDETDNIEPIVFKFG